jgi:lysophospholipase L1-like esterase
MAKSVFLITLALLTAPLLTASESGFAYLALGDSVPFGMNESLLPPFSTAPITPSEFIGYPETLANLDSFLGLNDLINAACPGETSGSFLNTATLDNGCNSAHVDPDVPAFKTTYGLHVSYTEAQMTYAMAQLKTNKQIKLVTLSIGANDVLLLLQACGTSTSCVQSNLLSVLGTYAGNLGMILTNIRTEYQGPIVLMTYYSPESALDSVTQALNATMTQVGNTFHNIAYADGYDAFQIASAPFNNDPCKAGLLVKFPPLPGAPACDIHPSALGRTILAATVDFALLTGQ